MQFLTRQQVREVDRLAIEQLGLPGVVLMENAGRHVAEIVLDALEHDLQLPAVDSRVAVLCGGGNNGGDGYVIARHLHNHGVAVTAFAGRATHQLVGDAAVHAQVAERMGLVVPMDEPALIVQHEDELMRCHLVVDALLGTGLSGDVRSPIADLIDLCNQARQRSLLVVAVDVPSGLDCETGLPGEPTVRADLTVTFVAPKVGFQQPEAAELLGQWQVADIGTPPELVREVLGSSA